MQCLGQKRLIRKHLFQCFSQTPVATPQGFFTLIPADKYVTGGMLIGVNPLLSTSVDTSKLTRNMPMVDWHIPQEKAI